MIKKVVGKKPINKKINSKKHPVKIVKKTAKRKTRRTTTIKKPRLTANEVKLEKILIENFVGLQKVMVNLSVKFDDLSNKLSKLLDLFEISAKALAEKDITMEKTSRDDDRMIKGLENLSSQNRVIARGITLMNEKLNDEPGYPNTINPQIKRPINPKNPMAPVKPMMPKAPEMGEYQESISSKPPTFKKLPTQEDAKTNF